MATPGELVRAVAAALDISDVTVGVYYRKLREAGLVTKGGRGRSAPALSYLDGARLLLSLLASETGVNAATEAQKFAILRSTEDPGMELEYPGFSSEHFRALTFEGAIEYLMQVLAASDYAQLVTDEMYPLVITARTDLSAEIRFAGMNVRYDDFPSDWIRAETGASVSPSRVSHDERMPIGLLVQRSIGGPAVGQIAACIRAPADARAS